MRLAVPARAAVCAMAITTVLGSCASSGDETTAEPSSPTVVETTDPPFSRVESTPSQQVASSTGATATSPPATASTTTATTTTSTTTSTTTTTTTTSTTTTAPATTPPTVAKTTAPVPGGAVPCPPTGSAIWDLRPPSALPAPDLPTGWTTEVIGSSAQGRDLVALARAVDDPRRTVVVIGGIHGNEPVSPPTVRGLVAAEVPADVEVWLVPELNPDGVAAGTRCNANGVDLNRNFPWGWRADDGGPSALSEPEPQAITGLIERLQPDLVIWVHQPYGYVSSIGPTADAFEQAWSTASGLPVRPDVSQHGGGESWTAFEAGVSSMLIEIGSWSATRDIVDRNRAGFAATVAALG